VGAGEQSFGEFNLALLVNGAELLVSDGINPDLTGTLVMPPA
jgi:hypothetical protein